MAMAYDNKTSGSATSVTNNTLAHTGTGTTLAAVAWLYSAVGLAGEASCTYDSKAMTQICYKQQTNQDIYLWALGNVPSGAKNVVATWTSSLNIVMGVMTFSGANPTANPIRSSGSSSGTGNSVHLADTVNSALGEYCVDAMAGGQGGEAMAPDAGQTEVYDLGVTGIEGAASYKAASAGTTTMGYTTGGSFQNAVHITATIAAPPAGGQVIFAMFKRWQDLYDRIRRELALPEWYLRRDRSVWAACYKSALRGCYAN